MSIEAYYGGDYMFSRITEMFGYSQGKIDAHDNFIKAFSRDKTAKYGSINGKVDQAVSKIYLESTDSSGALNKKTFAEGILASKDLMLDKKEINGLVLKALKLTGTSEFLKKPFKDYATNLSPKELEEADVFFDNISKDLDRNQIRHDIEGNFVRNYLSLNTTKALIEFFEISKHCYASGQFEKKIAALTKVREYIAANDVSNQDIRHAIYVLHTAAINKDETLARLKTHPIRSNEFKECLLGAVDISIKEVEAVPQIAATRKESVDKVVPQSEITKEELNFGNIIQKLFSYVNEDYKFKPDVDKQEANDYLVSVTKHLLRMKGQSERLDLNFLVKQELQLLLNTLEGIIHNGDPSIIGAREAFMENNVNDLRQQYPL